MFISSIKRELKRMGQQPVYLVMLLLLPIGCVLFFVSLMWSGLPTRTPVAVVDMDHSQLSRQVTRNLNAGDLVEIGYKLDNYNEAMEKVRSGEIFGFFLIPGNFEKDALAGNEPTLEFYSNMTYFVPGTLSFKGFKTVAVTTAGGIVTAKLTGMGATPGMVSSLVQPVIIDTHGIGNPWLNYSYYLTPSFSFATLALLIMIFTAYSITIEIKKGTSVEWLATAKGHITVALAGKLLPQTLLWIIVCVLSEAILFGFLHFPLNGSLGWLLLAVVLFVPACQAFAVFFCSILPNPRLSLSVICLLGILTFSFAGFSFPVEKMYGYIGIFSYIVPVRYLFLIYVNLALNGFDVYYVRYCYVALLIFQYVGLLPIWNLRRACLNPVYVP